MESLSQGGTSPQRLAPPCVGFVAHSAYSDSSAFRARPIKETGSVARGGGGDPRPASRSRCANGGKTMDRSSWIGALAGVLTCLIPCVAQSPPTERMITVTEKGKPAQKCRIL